MTVLPRWAALVALIAAFAVPNALAQQQQAPVTGEVVFAASPAPGSGQAGAAAAPPPPCANPCYAVQDYYPYRTCKAECSPEICGRNWGVWQSLEICCSPGVAFPEGCSRRPTECWVAEANYDLKTCIRDDRKCLQGYGVFPDVKTCCSPGAAFPDGCATNLTISAEPCFVADTYYPARTCRATRVACEKRGQTWPTKEACCAAGSGAFGEGCSTFVPSAPCWVVNSYNPRACRQESDIARCSRGYDVYQTQEICCAPGAGFSEGCSAAPAASPAAAPAAPVAPTAPPVTAAPAVAPVGPPATGAR